MQDNYLIPLFLSGTILLVLFVFFIIAYLLVHKKKQNIFELEKSKMAFDHQNKILQARIDEQEETLNMMSKEIHDNIGQLLGFSILNVTAIEQLATDKEQARLVNNTLDLLGQIKAGVHHISHSLNTEFIKRRGLLTVLKEETERINYSQQMKCSIAVHGTLVIMKPESELLIYRIAQEALHNATKYAQASELTIDLTYEDTGFVMRVADNGVGFHKDTIYELKGIGFQNMLQRAQMLKAELEIVSSPGEGCSITLRINDPGDARMEYKQPQGQEKDIVANEV